MRRSWRMVVVVVVLAGLAPVLPVGMVVADDAVVTTCDEASFDDALDSIQTTGGGAISFTCSGTITFSLVKVITSTVTIDGGGAITFDGGGSTGLFEVNGGGELELNAVTLQNGNAATIGGAIFNDGGTVTVTSSTFSGNSADHGGAISNDCGTVTVTSSTFSGNNAGVGGAIFNFDGTLTTTTSTFSGNSTSSFGGAVENDGGTVTVTGSTFSDNSTGVGGGAIRTDGGTATVTTSTFSGNSATNGHGGAIRNDGALTVTSSTFSGNSATNGLGGAIFFYSGALTVTSSTFSGNSADHGGAILNNLGTLTITGSIFSGNSGGAIGDGGDTLTVTSSTFSGNSADKGGAISNFDGTLTVTSSTFSGNSADEGGAISNYNNDALTVTSSTFSNNSAGEGGAIFNFDGTLTITSSTFNGNRATDGGAIYAIYNELADPTGTVTVGASILANNPAGDNCAGTLAIGSLGSNLSDDDSCALTGPGDIENSRSILLGPLADNGGPTQTMAPEPDSAAIDVADCALSSPQDQRGVARPLGAGCDIGAVEVGTPYDNFQRTWRRTDQPVADLSASRTWMWGPASNTDVVSEEYLEAPVGMRQVQYFDKARMEDNSWRTSEPPWDVTNGLLVVELITGQLQLGDASFESRQPAEVNVAGDVDDPTGPTYATFGGVLDVAPQSVGATIIQRIDRAGAVTDDPSLASQNVTVGFVDDITNHGIAEPFWAFMTSDGLVYEGGQVVTAPLFENPFFATGRPITEAYWANVKVANTYRDVLMQCFERRCLTYTPGNPEGFVVEAGNVGRHYYQWRYGQ